MNAPHVCPVTRALCDEAIRPTRRQPLRCGVIQARAHHMHGCPIGYAVVEAPATPNGYMFKEVRNG